jgi:leucyl aminopeptidase (aminopeptidase T)
MKISRNRLKEIVREVMVEETEYQAFFKKALEKAGKSIPQMSDEEKKAFFNKIDATWKGRGEKKEQVAEELTAAQKKLPPALQKAIEKKEKK